MDIFGRCENADPQDIEDWKNHMDSRHKAQRDKLREALQEVAMRIEGDLCQTVRDVINGLADANDVYDDAENIERIARAALAETKEKTQ